VPLARGSRPTTTAPLEEGAEGRGEIEDVRCRHARADDTAQADVRNPELLLRSHN
jgi:hypothetical protein